MDIIRRSIRRPFFRRQKSGGQQVSVIAHESSVDPVVPTSSITNGSVYRKKKSGKKDVQPVSPFSKSNSSTRNYCQADEIAVRSAVCKFRVLYLGSVEVAESRGITLCEGALQLLRARKQTTNAILCVSGDGIRVADQSGRQLIVDQNIERVSFCSPDRYNSKGFAYICRDGTTKRWMCHGFQAVNESGERLSHAVGCSFTVCLEKQRKRDAELVFRGDKSSSFISQDDINEEAYTNGSAPTHDGVFSRNNPAYATTTFRRQLSICERRADPQKAIMVKNEDDQPLSSNTATSTPTRVNSVRISSSISVPTFLSSVATSAKNSVIYRDHKCKATQRPASTISNLHITDQILPNVDTTISNSNQNVAATNAGMNGTTFMRFNSLRNFSDSTCFDGTNQKIGQTNNSMALKNSGGSYAMPRSARTLHNEPIYEGDDPEVHPQQPSDSGNKAATSTNFAQASVSPHQPSSNFIANSDVSKVSMESHPVIEQFFPPFSTFYQTAPTSLPIITSAPVSTTSNLSGANCADFWLDQNFEKLVGTTSSRSHDTITNHFHPNLPAAEPRAQHIPTTAAEFPRSSLSALNDDDDFWKIDSLPNSANPTISNKPNVSLAQKNRIGGGICSSLEHPSPSINKSEDRIQANGDYKPDNVEEGKNDVFPLPLSPAGSRSIHLSHSATDGNIQIAAASWLTIAPPPLPPRPQTSAGNSGQRSEELLTKLEALDCIDGASKNSNEQVKTSASTPVTSATWKGHIRKGSAGSGRRFVEIKYKPLRDNYFTESNSTAAVRHEVKISPLEQHHAQSTDKTDAFGMGNGTIMRVDDEDDPFDIKWSDEVLMSARKSTLPTTTGEHSMDLQKRADIGSPLKIPKLPPFWDESNEATI